MTGPGASRNRRRKKAKRQASGGKEISLEQIAPLLPLIDRVIYTYFRWALPKIKAGIYDIHDLRQEGVLGTIRAIELYNPKKGKLKNYASLHIRARIGKFLWQNSFPNIIIERHPRIRLNFTPFDQPIDGKLPTTATDIISLENYQATVSEENRQASVKQLVPLLLRQIPRQERNLLIKRFGICTCKRKRFEHCHQPMTLEQIGREKDVSRERIRQRLRKIFAEIRRTRNKTIKMIAREWETP